MALGKLIILILFGSYLAQCQTCNDPNGDYPPVLNVSTGLPFCLWCNLTVHQDLSAGFNIRWLRNGFQWCAISVALQNTTGSECVNRNISIDNVYNPAGTQDFQLTIPNATLTDSGNHTCSIVISKTIVTIRPNTYTLVFVSELESQATAQTTASTTTYIHSTVFEPTMSPTVQQKSPSPSGLSKKTIIAIGAGGGGGVLLVTIIVAVVCVKKKGKGNSTSDIDERRSSYRKTNTFEKSTENADDKRKSNPLEKNVENLHYADLTLHENPKLPSSKGTGSAKSKTLTVNPSDERVEYAAVMSS